MKLKELLMVLDTETLFKVRVDETGRKSWFPIKTLPFWEINKHLEYEVELVLWTEHNGIVVLISNEKSPQGED